MSVQFKLPTRFKLSTRLSLAVVCAFVTLACGSEAITDYGYDGGNDGAIAKPDAGSRDADVPDAVPVEGDAYEPGSVPPPLEEASLTALQGKLNSALSSISDYSNSFKIVDAENGQVIYERNPARTLKPASNTKLFTTAAALDLFGPDHRLETKVFGTKNGSAIDGNLLVVVDHDTFNPLVYPSNDFAMHSVANLLSGLGIGSVSGTVQLKGEMVYAGSSVGEGFAGSTGSFRTATLGSLRNGLNSAGIEYNGSETAGGFGTPDGADPLLIWPSPPIEVAASATNVVSHNLFADMMLRAIGHHFGTGNTYAAGFDALKSWLASTGAPTDGLSLSDGSGLSYSNRVSANHVVGLFDGMQKLPAWRPWASGMAISGVRGTIASRMTGSATRGRFFGKTGTLLGESTIALGGVLRHPHDGHRYFASFISNISYNSLAARNAMKAAMDRAVTTLAQHKRSDANRPPPPVLNWVRSDANGATITVSWTEVSNASRYRVWFSDDGIRWPWEDSRIVEAPPFRAADLSGDGPVFVRVSALYEGGESETSDVYPARTSSAASKILIVDANDRWQAQPTDENAAALSHDFLLGYPAGFDVAGFEEAGFDTVDNDALGDFTERLGNYDVIIWAAGEEGEEHETFNASERAVLRGYLQAGGAILASGAEIAFDLDRKGSDATQFLQDAFGASFASDDAGTWSFAPSALPTSIYHFHSPSQMIVGFPDVLTPTTTAEAWLRYAGGAGGVAAVRQANLGRSILVGFPLESVVADASRRTLLHEALTYLSTP